MAALVALLPGCAREVPKPAAPDLSYLPADSVLAAYVDTVRLREAPFYRAIGSSPKEGRGRWQEVTDFLRKVGIEPEKDLESVMFAYRGRVEEPGDWVLVLRGRPDVARIEKHLQDPEARMSAEAYGKWTIHHLIRVPEIGDISITIPDASAVALGKAGTLKKVLDVRSGSSPPLSANRTMARLIAGVDPRAQLWAVLDGKELRRMMRYPATPLPESLPAPGLKGLGSVSAGQLSMALAEDLELSMTVESDTEKAAHTLADALRGILAFGQLGTEGRDADTAKLIEGFRIEDHRSSIQVRLNLDSETFRRLRGRFEAATPAPAPPPPLPPP